MALTVACRRCGVVVRSDRMPLHDLEHDGNEADHAQIAQLAAQAPQHLTFHQQSAAAQWTWQHNLGRFPDVTLFTSDDPDHPCFTDVTYTDANTIIIEWPQPETGWAYI